MSFQKSLVPTMPGRSTLLGFASAQSIAGGQTQTVLQQATTTSGLPRLCLLLGIAALLVRMQISPSLLLIVGINYESPGGNPFFKLHLGTYLMNAALIVLLFNMDEPRVQLTRYFRAAIGNLLFISMMLLCIGHVFLNIGKTGVAVYVDSYLCAGVAALIFEQASVHQRCTLGYILLAVISVNASIGIAETLVQIHLVPFASKDLAAFEERATEFRGVALYGHPLGGAVTTMLGVFLLLQMQLKAAATVPLMLLLMLGLVAFGGRTALVTTSLTLMGLGVGYLVRETVTRRLKLKGAASALVVAVCTPALIWYALNATSIGTRIASRMFFDESAAARNEQWEVLRLIPLNFFLMGTPVEQAMAWAFDLGIVDFESFWLATFITLGVIGFIYFLLGFVPFIIHLWRIAPLFGQIALLTGISVASTSNSLARKSDLLVILTAIVIATTGFKRPLLVGQSLKTTDGPQSPAPARTSFRASIAPDVVVTERLGNASPARALRTARVKGSPPLFSPQLPNA